MPYTLATAARATGLNKSTILRAIKGGRVIGTKDQFGQWRIEPVELHRVYPAVAELNAGSDEPRPHAKADTFGLHIEIETLIRRAEHLLQQQLDEVCRAKGAIAKRRP